MPCQLQRDTENVLNRKVQELEAELQRSRSHMSSISRDAEKAARAEQELANMRNRVKSLEGAEEQMKALHKSLQVGEEGLGKKTHAPHPSLPPSLVIPLPGGWNFPLFPSWVVCMTCLLMCSFGNRMSSARSRSSRATWRP